MLISEPAGKFTGDNIKAPFRLITAVNADRAAPSD
jgi:hypothetical protein